MADVIDYFDGRAAVRPNERIRRALARRRGDLIAAWVRQSLAEAQAQHTKEAGDGE